MKKKKHMWLLLLVFMVFLLTLVAANPYKSQSNPWKGKWWSIDLDGSLQSVVFLGSNQFKYVDRGATICGVDQEGIPLYRADGRGSGSISDLSFTGTTTLRCLTHPPYVWGEHTFVWTYDPATNTITDGFTTYTRSRP